MKKHINVSVVCISIVSVIACFIMYLTNGVFAPPYYIKWLVKIVLFCVLPLLYMLIANRISKKDGVTYFFPKTKIKGRGLLFSVFLGIIGFGIILLAYLITKNHFDFSGIVENLNSSCGITASNYVYFAIYSTLISSTVEEFFFRKFVFLNLAKLSDSSATDRNNPTPIYAYVFSAALFAFYHVAIIKSWFNIWPLILYTLSLFVVGILFNWLDKKSKTIFSSLAVHIAASISINLIGFHLFGII